LGCDPEKKNEEPWKLCGGGQKHCCLSLESNRTLHISMSQCASPQQEKKNPNLIKASPLLQEDSEVTTALSSPLSHDSSQPPPLQREEM
jgi:hypothetical protein